MPTPGNSINEVTTGICGFTGTAFTGTPATNHAVIVGAATSSTLTNVGPSATAGSILQSAGASADPLFSTASYPSTAGTSGNVITSDGTNFISSPISSSFAPNSTINFFDDFIFAANSSTTIFSQLQWQILDVTTPTKCISATSSARPGILAFGQATTKSGIIATTTSLLPIILGGGVISINWVINVATLSTAGNAYTLIAGLSDTGSAEPVNGVYMSYTHSVNSGAWVGKTASASTRSSANSANTVSAGAWVNVGVTVNAAASSVSYFINGVQITNSPLASNIPTTGLTPIIYVFCSAGTFAANSVLVDLFYMSQTLTTPR